MMHKSLWQQLKDVVDCDKQITTLQSNIDHLEKEIKHDQQQNVILQNDINEKKHILFTTQKELQLKELHANELKDKEDHKRAQLDTVKDQKVYMALEKEITTLSQERQSLDDEIVKKWYLLDKIKQELEQSEQAVQEKMSVITHDLQIKDENLTNLQTKLVTLQQQRYVAMQHVQPEWQAQYERMRHSVPDPIVQVYNESCGSCFYAIPHHDVMKLKKSQLIICRSCYRFLYWGDDTTPSTTY